MKMKFAVRLTAAVLVAVMSLSAVASCKPKGFEGSSTPAGSLILGEILTLTPNGNNKAISLVDNSGMSGIEASNHLAGTDAKDMYVFENGQGVVLQHTEAESLGQLYIWNYSESGKTNCGVKELNIKYSVDGTNWTDFGNVTLPEASQAEIDAEGGCVAANYGDPINLNGVPGKYICLTPVSNHGGEFTGLAEVRLFRHKIRPGNGYMITGEVLASKKDVTATPGTNPSAAMNNQGMSDLSSKTATHNNIPADMWYAESADQDIYYVLSLDGTYPVKEIVFWNYNDPANLGAGINEFEIYYTVESPCDIDLEKNNDEKPKNINETINFTNGAWKKLEIGEQKSFTMAKADGSEALAASLVLTLDEVVQAQHIKIVPKSNHGGAGYGLSEVRFFAGKGWGVEPAREWTGLLSSSGTFDYQGSAVRDGGGERDGGWVGADGIHMYTMNGGTQQQGALNENSKTFILFQDTVVANMNNYKGWTSTHGYKASHSGWVNMSYLVIDGSEPDVRKVQFILKGKNSENHPYGDICDRHYWIGDMTMINGKMYAMATRYMGWDKPEGPEGYDLIEIFFDEQGNPDMDKVPVQIVDSKQDPERGGGIPWYARGAIFENTKEAGAPNPDGYIYVFSTNGGKFRVSRCLPEDYAGNYDKWEFWGGEKKGWLNDSDAAFKVMQSQMSTYSIGNESNVVYSSAGPFAGKYLNLFTADSVFGQIKIGMTDSLTSKFAGPELEEGKLNMSAMSVMWAPEQYEYVLDRGYEASEQWDYNAKIQITLSKPGELLFTYHIGINNTIQNTVGLEYVHPVFYNMFQIG